jgi:hypothetical protein
MALIIYAGAGVDRYDKKSLQSGVRLDDPINAN